MDTKIVRLSSSTRVGTRLYPTLRRVLNGLKNCEPKWWCQAGSKKEVLCGTGNCSAYMVLNGCEVGRIRSWEGFCMSISGFYIEPNIVTLGSFRHPERTWPNLSIYVPTMTRSDPVRRPYFRFERSLIESCYTRLNTQSALWKNYFHIVIPDGSQVYPVPTMILTVFEAG